MGSHLGLLSLFNDLDGFLDFLNSLLTLLVTDICADTEANAANNDSYSSGNTR